MEGRSEGVGHKFTPRRGGARGEQWRMDPTRVACVRYLNTAVLVEGLSKLPELSVIPTVPARIAGMVRGGEADIGLVSLIDSAGGDFALLPVGIIGCDGPTLTVRLYSSVPTDRITRIHADTDSHTSVALVRVLMREMHGRDVEIVDFNAREQMPVWLSGGMGGGHAESVSGGEEGTWPEAMLLIGDKVVTDSPPAVRYPYQLDLGETWKGLTGLPFVYAMWACRAGEENDERIRLAAELLDRQLRHNLTRIDWIITRRAPEHRWPTDLARRYLGGLLRFTVSEREMAGAELFAKKAAAMGLVSGTGLRWASVGAASPTFVPAQDLAARAHA